MEEVIITCERMFVAYAHTTIRTDEDISIDKYELMEPSGRQVCDPPV
jgi:hypothetical protein